MRALDCFHTVSKAALLIDLSGSFRCGEPERLYDLARIVNSKTTPGAP
jgi:hypothetical protein